MIFLRSALFTLFLLVFTPIWSILCLLAFPFLNPENRYRFIGLWNKVVIWLLQPLCGIHYEIRGMKNMYAVLDQPVVVLSKHQSAYETIAYIALLPKQLCFVFKRELLWIPFFGWALALLKMIHINRASKETAALSVASQGRKRLAEGKWIMLFSIGPAIASAGKTGGQLHQEVEKWIEAEMRVIDPDAYKT